jgi:hypothetical protein
MDVLDVDTQLDRLDALVDDLRGTVLHLEVGCCDTSQLARASTSITTIRNMTDAIKADIAARAAELRQAGNSKPVDDAVNPGGRRSPGEERADTDRAGVLGHLPGLDDATRAGELSGRYADIIARAVKNLDREVVAEFYRRHQNLAKLAAGMSEQAFREYVSGLVQRVLDACGIELRERQRRNRTARTFTDLDGMFGLSGRWDPHTGQMIGTAITAEVNAIYHGRRDDPADTRTRGQITADAVSNLLCGTPVSRTGTTGGGTTVVVITDQQTSESGVHDESVHEYADGTPVAPGTLTDLLDDDDTTIIPATVNAHGMVTSLGDETLDHGRDRRLASEAQRLALRTMHRSCIIPGCDTPFGQCEIHHLAEWERGGRTDLTSLGPLCTRHHHTVHSEHWKLRFDPKTRALTITYPDGTTETIPHHGLAPPGHSPPAA